MCQVLHAKYKATELIYVGRSESEAAQEMLSGHLEAWTRALQINLVLAACMEQNTLWQVCCPHTSWLVRV